MPGILIRHGEWVVVCDGAKALVLENVGNTKFPDLRTREVHEQKDPPTRALGTDAPGRAMNSVGAVRSAVRQTDWHEQAERAFLEQLVARLDAAVTSGESRSFILAAPPRALGTIRQLSPPAVRAAIRAEIDKDYVRLPVDEIKKHLVA